jgi:ubiquinone/menaquinone biosynthesis C-methylase UbiE
MANVMGPHPLWLAEWLTGAMRLEPGMRVLDLGCGTALTTVFLAREFGVHVTASRPVGSAPERTGDGCEKPTPERVP